MSMTEWARREVELACKKEAPDRKDGEWDYGCACYESALKAYESLMADGHSGFSFGLTKNILIRLLDELPLTPIEDTPDNWNLIGGESDNMTTYQCTRRSSLFKDVHKNGSATFHDSERVKMYEVYPDGTLRRTHFGFVGSIVDEYVPPISFPYYPSAQSYQVFFETLGEEPGTFDTVGILYYTTPEGDKFEINRFFKEVEDKNNPLHEIDFYEYDRRKRARA